MDALSSDELKSIQDFMLVLFSAAKNRKDASLQTTGANLISNAPDTDTSSNPFLTVPDVVRSAVRHMNFLTLAPLSYYQLQSHNIYDYEIPPGLITLNGALVIVELFRRGGRLVPSSVHKLLRLGYKLLKSRPNISTVSISETDRLIVVGDIHG